MDGKTNEITIYDIAESAGVSVATVSRVINNNPQVNKKTRAKVLKVLQEKNYVPNMNARSLAIQSSKIIGILIADMRTAQHTEGVYYVEHEFSKKGYSCLIYNTSSDPDQQVQYIQLLSQRKIDAVVMMGSIYQNEKIKAAIDTYIPSIPVAMCNGYIQGDNIYGVVSDEKNGVSDCVKLLADKGRQHIAFIYNYKTPSNLEKIRGFEEGIAKYNQHGTKLLVQTDNSGDAVSETVEKVMKEHPETDGIIFSEDYLALIGMNRLCTSGHSVPKDVSVIGINNSKYSMYTIPPLTTLDNMLYDSTLISVRSILQVLAGEHTTKKLMLSCNIVERSST